MAKLASILGESLIGGGGGRSEDVSLTADALAGKAACILYFSAHWCPPCRGFTPKLIAAYKDYKASLGDGAADAEIVFVSWDNDSKAFVEYFAEMPWLAIPYEGTKELREKLGPTFGVEGIPHLVVLGPDGEELHPRQGHVDLRELVDKHKAAAFPMTPTRITELQVQEQEQVAAVLKELAAGTLLPQIAAPGGDLVESNAADVLRKFDYFAFLFSDGDGSDSTYKRLASVQAEVNQSGSCLGVIYLGWSLYNDDSDHKPLAKLFHSLLDLPDALKERLACLAGSVRAPHIVIVGGLHQTAPEIVISDVGGQKVLGSGAAGFPWSKVHLAELEKIEEARIEEVRAKMTNLEALKGSSSREGLPRSCGAEVSIASLAAGGPTGIIGLYFSAHWCPPCRGFTPQLAKCYNDLRAAGKSFEVVVVSSDSDEEAFKEYFAEMPWLALPFSERDLAKDLNKVFDVNGIPCLVLLKPDGSVLTLEGREAVGLGPEFFPWGPEDLERGRAAAKERQAREREQALQAEVAAVEAQRTAGGPVLRRLIGAPGEGVVLQPESREVHFKMFSTVGAPDSMAKSGVLYYEVEILPSDGIPQLGFASGEFRTGIDECQGDGVGDDAESWGLDGIRKLAWHEGSKDWACGWSAGDVIGLAANVDLGKIAVAKNGDWSGDGCGVVFDSEKIKMGVYPCLTAGDFRLRYNFDGSTHGTFRYSPPPEDMWSTRSSL